jgi:hypothetical protein
MKWIRALAVGGIAAILAYLFAAVVGSIVTGVGGMSDFEGERSMFVAFVLAPAGLLVGLIAGIAFGQRAGRGPGPFFKQLGLAIGTSWALIAIVGLAAYTTVDRPPTVDGKHLEVAFEIRIPASSTQPADLKVGAFLVSLTDGERDSRYADMQFDATRSENGARVIPGASGLYTHSNHRQLLVGSGPGPSQMFDLPLPPTPALSDSWSEWLAPTTFADLTPIPDAEKFALRYHVRFAR